MHIAHRHICQQNTDKIIFSFQFLKIYSEPELVTHTFNPSTWEAETDRSLEFEASQAYKPMSRTPRLEKPWLKILPRTISQFYLQLPNSSNMLCSVHVKPDLLYKQPLTKPSKKEFLQSSQTVVSNHTQTNDAHNKTMTLHQAIASFSPCSSLKPNFTKQIIL